MQLVDDRLLLSASDLINYLECAHLTRLDLEVVRGEIVLEETRTDAADLVARKGDEHEQAYLDSLRVGMGVSYREEGDLDEASEYFEIADEAASSPKERAIARYHLGLVALLERDEARARDAFRSCVDALPGCAMGWVGLARALVESGDIPRAREILRSIRAREDMTPELGDAVAAAKDMLVALGV